MPAIPAFGRLRQKDCHDFKASLGLYGNYQAQQKLHRKREERKEGGREGERKEGRKEGGKRASSYDLYEDGSIASKWYTESQVLGSKKLTVLWVQMWQSIFF